MIQHKIYVTLSSRAGHTSAKHTTSKANLQLFSIRKCFSAFLFTFSWKKCTKVLHAWAALSVALALLVQKARTCFCFAGPWNSMKGSMLLVFELFFPGRLQQKEQGICWGTWFSCSSRSLTKLSNQTRTTRRLPCLGKSGTWLYVYALEKRQRC